MVKKDRIIEKLNLIIGKVLIAKKLYKNQGIKATSYIISYSIKRWILSRPFAWYFTRVRINNKFNFNGKQLNYFYHPYNMTWDNERAIEVPIIMTKVRGCEGKILEVGNVLKHYYPLNHEVIDKYESSNEVRNIDIEELSTNETYDLIVSISTLEHVGKEEKQQDANKAVRAIKILKNILKRRGSMIVTIPLGHNKELDRKRKKLFSRITYFRRINMDWIKISEKELKCLDTTPQFGIPFRFIYIGEYKKI